MRVQLQTKARHCDRCKLQPVYGLELWCANCEPEFWAEIDSRDNAESPPEFETALHAALQDIGTPYATDALGFWIADERV